jgi:hypothetical protein
MKTRSNLINYVTKLSDRGRLYRQKRKYNNLLQKKKHWKMSTSTSDINKFIHDFEEKIEVEVNEQKKLEASTSRNDITSTLVASRMIRNQSDEDQPITCLDFGVDRHKNHPNFYFCSKCDEYEQQLLLKKTPYNKCKYRCTAGHTTRTVPTVYKDEKLHSTLYARERKYSKMESRENQWELDKNARLLQNFQTTIDRFSSYLQNWNHPPPSSTPPTTATGFIASQGTTTISSL